MNFISLQAPSNFWRIQNKKKHQVQVGPNKTVKNSDLVWVFHPKKSTTTFHHLFSFTPRVFHIHILPRHSEDFQIERHLSMRLGFFRPMDPPSKVLKTKCHFRSSWKNNYIHSLNRWLTIPTYWFIRNLYSSTFCICAIYFDLKVMGNWWFGVWWCGIRFGVPLSNNPFHKGILRIQTTGPQTSN